jgi:TIR domain
MNVFISYSRSDKDFAQALAEELQGHGISVFDPKYFSPGEDWTSAFRKKIEESTALILVLPSSDSPHRNNLWFEAGAAKALGKPVLAVVPPHQKIAHSQLPTDIANLLVLDAEERPLEQLADMLIQALPHHGTSTVSRR